MTNDNARYLWATLCRKTVGGNETESYEQETAIGMIALSHDLPLAIYGKDQKDRAAKVADFLENWAKALRDVK